MKEFDSIKKLIPQTVGSYKKERDRVAQKFADMGMQMPNLDEDFDKNSEALLSNTSFLKIVLLDASLVPLFHLIKFNLKRPKASPVEQLKTKLKRVCRKF